MKMEVKMKVWSIGMNRDRTRGWKEKEWRKATRCGKDAVCVCMGIAKTWNARLTFSQNASAFVGGMSLNRTDSNISIIGRKPSR